jgi:hypothetical protein
VRELQAVGFEGSLGIELDLIAPQFADTPEPELVTQSLEFLRTLIAGVAA